MAWSWRLIGPFLISFTIGPKNFLPTFQLMSRSSIDLGSELDPEDSISREGISDERSRVLGNMDLDHSSVTPSTTTFIKPKTSNYGDYIYVKDDKYESNTKYLEGILGVFLSSLVTLQC